MCGARRPGYVLSRLPCVREPHTDAVHADVHGVAWPATPVQAAAGVIRASIEQGHGTPAEIAQAEEDAGLLFDPQRGKDIDTAAREQSAAEYRAEIEDLRERLGSQEWFRTRLQAVIALCVGRPDWHMMSVREILNAADVPTAPAPGDGPLLALHWDRIVMGPSGDTPRENTLVPCRTQHGSPAALVLDDEQRLALGGLLLASLHAAEACQMLGCGQTESELDAYCDEFNRDLSGWILLRVHGTDGPARWWCSSWCANSAITAAGAELAAADAAAGQAPTPYELTEHVAQVIASASDSAAAAAVAPALLLAEEGRLYDEALLDGADDVAGGAW